MNAYVYEELFKYYVVCMVEVGLFTDLGNMLFS